MKKHKQFCNQDLLWKKGVSFYREGKIHNIVEEEAWLVPSRRLERPLFDMFAHPIYKALGGRLAY